MTTFYFNQRNRNKDQETLVSNLKIKLYLSNYKYTQLHIKVNLISDWMTLKEGFVRNYLKPVVS